MSVKRIVLETEDSDAMKGQKLRDCEKRIGNQVKGSKGYAMLAG